MKKIIIDKRQNITDAATWLFKNAHNMRKVSMEDIASRASVSPTTIYNYFGTREALLSEVAKILVLESIEHNGAVVHSEIPFPQKIMAIVGGKLDLVQKLNAELITKMISQDKTISPFFEKIYQREIKPLYLEILADGKQQGYIDPSLNTEAFIIYLDVIKAGFQSRPDLAQDLTEKRPLIKELSRIMFHGFLKRDVDLFQNEAT